MISSFYKTSLSVALTAGDTTTTSVFVDHATNIQGETIAFSQWSPFTRGTIVVNPSAVRGGDQLPEIINFTGFDSTLKKFTGCTRGMSGITDAQDTSLITFHPAGTDVIVTWSGYNITDLLAYIATTVSGTTGTASDSTSGSTKITENLTATPRAMAALVSAQATPNMTLKVNPFAIVVLDSIVNYTGGNTTTIVAPVSNPRIDLIVYSTTGSAIAVRGGTEAGSPTEPTPTNGDIVLASVYLRVGTTAIYERDDSVSTHAYIKRWYQPERYGQIVSTSAGSTDAGKIIKTNASGKIDGSFGLFGGTGADGALAITSGATNIDLGSAAVVTKNYTSISITGTGSLTFTNPHANGTIIILKSQGNVSITSSTNPAIDLRSIGALANNYANGTMFGANTGITYIGGSGIHACTILGKGVSLSCGAGGASGVGGGSWSGGSGGVGGGSMYIECYDSLNITSTFNSVGTNGSNGSSGGGSGVAGPAGGGGGANSNGTNGTNATAAGGPGGGGGGGGSVVIVYTTLVANSSTFTLTGGTGGVGGNSVSLTGGTGGTGYSLVTANTEFF